LKWADRDYVPPGRPHRAPAAADADAATPDAEPIAADAEVEEDDSEEDGEPAEEVEGDDDVLFVGIRPATTTTLAALLGTMTPIENRARELVETEQRDAFRQYNEIKMNAIESAMYGEVVARKMGKVIACYEVRGRTRAQAMPLLQRIFKLCEVCDMAKLLSAKCDAFCPFDLAPFVFGRLVRSAVLFNRRNDYILDAQQLFFFLFHCF
jgi:hypothetical protein